MFQYETLLSGFRLFASNNLNNFRRGVSYVMTENNIMRKVRISTYPVIPLENGEKINNIIYYRELSTLFLPSDPSYKIYPIQLNYDDERWMIEHLSCFTLLSSHVVKEDNNVYLLIHTV